MRKLEEGKKIEHQRRSETKMSLKEKAKFAKDIFKTLADAFRLNYDLWNTLQFELWVRFEDAQAEIDEKGQNYARLVASLNEKRVEEKKNLQDFLEFLQQKYNQAEQNIRSGIWQTQEPIYSKLCGESSAYSEVLKKLMELLKE